MTFHTDLALERTRRLGQRPPAGVSAREERCGRASVTLVTVENDEGARALEKPPGHYYTVEGRPFDRSVDDSDDQVRAAAQVLGRLLPPRGLVLVVGLGNRRVTPDALGPLTADRVIATRHLGDELRAAGRMRPTAVLAPGVLPQTGLEAAELAHWAARRLKPAAVVAVDALAAAEPCRLGRTIQISDTGIAPGSGVRGRRCALDSAGLGVPVVSMGVPTVIEADTFVSEYLRLVGVQEEMIAARQKQPLMVTPHDVDLVLARSARCLALALNLALQPQLSPEEIRVLMS